MQAKIINLGNKCKINLTVHYSYDDSHEFEFRNKAAEQKRHWIRLTNVCNQKCIFCHDRENHKGGVRSFAEIRKEMFSCGDFVERLKTAGLDEVTLSLHSHLRDPFEKISCVKGAWREYPDAFGWDEFLPVKK